MKSIDLWFMYAVDFHGYNGDYPTAKRFWYLRHNRCMWVSAIVTAIALLFISLKT